MIAVAAPPSLAVVAAIAVSLGGLLPAPHAHFDREVAIVHVHGGNDSGASHHDLGMSHDRAAFDHGDHSTAPLVVSSYEMTARFALTVTTVVTAASIVVPDPVGISQPSRAALLPTHDPPLRFTSSPAPPAVA